MLNHMTAMSLKIILLTVTVIILQILLETDILFLNKVIFSYNLKGLFEFKEFDLYISIIYKNFHLSLKF